LNTNIKKKCKIHPNFTIEKKKKLIKSTKLTNRLILFFVSDVTGAKLFFGKILTPDGSYKFFEG
jgi:hypothetical protein